VFPNLTQEGEERDIAGPVKVVGERCAHVGALQKLLHLLLVEQL
jgi:hypothetical protein